MNCTHKECPNKPKQKARRQWKVFVDFHDAIHLRSATINAHTPFSVITVREVLPPDRRVKKLTRAMIERAWIAYQIQSCSTFIDCLERELGRKLE